ncbi:MAG: radical SAM protein [Deltaproteobacteria bacterium]|nr:radical SAM protein [Deltaproteobacteria bacterium]
MGYLNNWQKFPQWLFRHSLKAIPVSNGALGMGCIGYPGHPVWEVTAACNLNCIHCHAASGKPHPHELSTDEGKRLIDQLAEVDGFRTLVYSGGEPLVRPDIFDLLKHSKDVGFANIIATNGILIDEEMAWKLKEHGVVCNAISIDASDPDIHNFVRNSPKAFDLALRAIEATRKAGILLQINTTAMEYNMENLSDLIDFVDQHDASIMLMYQLVAVGRGGKIERATLKKSANENLSRLIAQKQKQTRAIIEPVAGPQYWPYILEKKGIQNGLLIKIAEQVFHGCAAGRGFVYIKANGEVWPCPFVEVNTGNVREKPFSEIYEEAPVFKNLRNRENLLKGLCGDCRYKKICGGCRGRAWAYSGDYLAEDPRCFIRSDK